MRCEGDSMDSMLEKKKKNDISGAPKTENKLQYTAPKLFPLTDASINSGTSSYQVENSGGVFYTHS